MASSYLCPRCARRHDTTTPCDLAAALRTLLAATAAQQRRADQLEMMYLARYHLQRRLRS
jgi:hypothetical protein